MNVYDICRLHCVSVVYNYTELKYINLITVHYFKRELMSTTLRFALSLHNRDKIAYMSAKFSETVDMVAWVSSLFAQGYEVTQVQVKSNKLYIISGQNTLQPNRLVTNLFNLDKTIYGPAYILPVDPHNTEEQDKCVNMRRILNAHWKVYQHSVKRLKKQSRQINVVLKKGVKKVRRPYDFFASEFHKSVQSRKDMDTMNFSQITAEARKAWTEMSEEAKQSYVSMSVADEKRYKEQLDAFKQQFPMPASKPRKAHAIYMSTMRAQGKEVKPWRQVNATEKQKFINESASELEKMVCLNTKFLKWCDKYDLEPTVIVKYWKKHGFKQATVLKD